MKRIWTVVLPFILVTSALGQSGTIVFGAGVLYTAGEPSFTANARGSQIAMDTVTGTFYVYDTVQEDWIAQGSTVEFTGATGAPTYTPGASGFKHRASLAVNAGDSLYVYQTPSWSLISGSGGGGGGGGTDDQVLTIDSTGRAFTITIEDGNSVSFLDTDTDTQLSQEQVEDFAGAMVTGNTETLITSTYSDATGKINLAVQPNLSNYTNDAGFLTAEVDGSTTNELQTIDTFDISANILRISLSGDGEAAKTADLSPYLDDTVLSQEEVEDYSGGLFTGNTETRITSTYSDATGKVNLVVEGNLSNYTNDAGFLTAETDDQVLALDSTASYYTLSIESGNSVSWNKVSPSGEVNDLTSVVTWANVPDANITQSSVTQHQAALTITESQISDLAHTVNTDDQVIDTFDLVGSTVRLSLEADGQPAKTIDLSAGFLTADYASTGIISGGGLTINGGDNTKLDIAAGVGYIADQSTDPITLRTVTWTAKTAVTLDSLTTDFATDIAIDSLGNVVQQKQFTNEEKRRLIFLGGVDHNNKTNISNTFSVQIPVNGIGSSLFELSKAIGDINLTGNVFSAAGANLNINKSAGTAFSYGRANVSSKTDPHTTTQAAKTPVTFNYVFNNGAGVATFGGSTTNIDPDQYDNGSGTLATVGNNNWTIQRFLVFSNSGTVFVQYGTEEFSKKADAISGLNSTNFVALEGIKTAMVRGYLVVKKGATALNGADAQFVDATKFGGIGGGGSTDDQVVDTFDIVANTLRLSLEADGEPFNSVDLSPYLDNTDTQDLTIDSTGRAFTISLTNGGSVSFRDTDTDTQLSQEQVEDFAGGMVTGNTETLITVTYDDPTGKTNYAVEPNLSNYTNDAGFLTAEVDGSTTNELQYVDTLALAGTVLGISLVSDGQPQKTVDLSSLQDGTGTDDQTLSWSQPNLSIESGNSVDLSGLLDNTDTQDLSLDSTATWFTLSLTDGGSVSFPKVTDTDTQLSQEQVEDYSGAMFTGNTESLITSTYDDPTGKVNLTVQPNLSNYTNDAGFLTGNQTITLSGDVTGSGATSITTDIATGVVGANELASTAVTPGSYTNASITVDADGRLTAASSGAASTDDQALTLNGTGPTYIIDIEDGADITVSAAGIATLSEPAANELRITATEVDGSTTNELQNFTGSDDGTTFTWNLSDAANDPSIREGQNITMTRSGEQVTIATSVFLAHGTWSPSLSSVTNIDALTSYTGQYLRVGNTVTCSGMFAADPTTINTTTSITMTLPVASDLANDYELAGTGAEKVASGVNTPVLIYGDGTSDVAVITWRASGTANSYFWFHFTYQVLGG